MHSNMLSKSNIYLQNHLNFILQQHNKFIKINYSFKLFTLIKIFVLIGFLYNFLIILVNNKKNPYKNFILTIFFYKNVPFFKSCCLVSTQSLNYFINIKALRLLKLSLGFSILILSTSRGIISHKKALYYKIGGLILYILR